MNPALQSYKSFVDGIVGITKGVHAEWVMKHGWPKTMDNEEINSLLSALTSQQKKVLVRLLEEERRGGIHDVLVFLHDSIAVDGYRLTKDRMDLPVGEFESIYYDWHCRICGDPWPDERPAK